MDYWRIITATINPLLQYSIGTGIDKLKNLTQNSRSTGDKKFTPDTHQALLLQPRKAAPLVVSH